MNQKVYLAVNNEKVNTMYNACTKLTKMEHNYSVQLLLKQNWKKISGRILFCFS